MITALKRGRPQETVPAGTTWTITQGGQWEVPATGQYQVELHGGGGGGVYGNMYGASGGGSGQSYTTELEKGEVVNISIGLGGVRGAGGISSFKDFAILGGGVGTVNGINQGGAASGNLATAGQTTYFSSVLGGLGNKNKPSQTYGNGGAASGTGANMGQPGAAIITFLGA